MGRDKLSTCEGAGKWFLVVVNVIFVLLGLALFILGMIVRFSPETILDNYLEPLLTQRDQQNPNNEISIQIQNQISQLDLSDILNVIGIVVIVIGVIMLAIGLLGLFGATCLVRCMLIAYAVVVIVAVIVQFGVCIAYFTQKEAVDELVRVELRNAINNEYRGEDAADAYSVALNYLFIEGECCGVDSYTDMQSARQWRRNYNYRGQQYTLAHPFTCCKLPGTFPNYQRPDDLTCAVTPTQVNSNFDRGCFQVIDEFITAKITTTAIAVFVVLGIIQIAAIVFAILLAVAVGRNGW